MTKSNAEKNDSTDALKGTKRLILWFGLLELLASCFIFRGAILGKELLAPLDVAPAFLTKYQYLGCETPGVPANHHIVDQLYYDLPIQLTVHRAYHRGEIPWWDPYDSAGRPLLADAHINGTDPLRCLLYALLPFEPAYNWTFIGHFFLTGFSMLVLLRHFGFREWQCALLAVTYQFSTALTLHFAQQWVQAVYVYYPLLWLAWDRWIAEQRWTWVGLAALLIAGIFYSGNLQSDSYLALFVGAFLLGYGGLDGATWKRGLAGTALSLFLGFCLAAPVLLGQLELFLLSGRKIQSTFHAVGALGGIASLSAVYPWAIGTFRTLDLSKLADQIFHYGFALFIGSAAVFLAFMGAVVRGEPGVRLQNARRTALWLIAFYLVIASTPLESIFYLRSSGLAAMALILLVAIGITSVMQTEKAYPRFGRCVIVTAVVCALLTNGFAFAVYPKLLLRVREKVLHQSSTHLVDVVALRTFQVENLAREISFRNPETVLAFGSLIFLGSLLMSARLRRKPGWWLALLVLNSLPVLMYSARFIPRQPMEMWQRLLAGGPEQQRLSTALGKHRRILEIAANNNEQAFSAGMSHLYRVRTVHGYTSLPLNSLASIPDPLAEGRIGSQVADLIYRTQTNSTVGELTTNSIQFSRFQWVSALQRGFVIDEPSLNQIKIAFEPGDAGTFLWTDTFYPGWNAFINGREVPLRKREPCFSTMEVPGISCELVLQYRPRFLTVGNWIAVFGLLGAAGLFLLRAQPLLPVGLITKGDQADIAIPTQFEPSR